jgi:arabinofuranan 3-O-arabinosyltransferase
MQSVLVNRPAWVAHHHGVAIQPETRRCAYSFPWRAREGSNSVWVGTACRLRHSVECDATSGKVEMRAQDLTGRGLSWWKHHGPLASGAVAWLAVIAIAISRARSAASTPAAGMDLAPIRNAGMALRSGHPIYGVPAFVYPPPASLVGWVESFFSLRTDVYIYTYFEVAAIVATVFLFRRCLRPVRWNLLESAILAFLLLKGDLVIGALWLDNASVLLLLPCLFIVILWAKNRWSLGAVVLGITILIKPILLPLLMIPLIFRRWKSLFMAVSVASVGLLMSVLISGNARAMYAVAKKLEGGSSLVRKEAVYNLSIIGMQHNHHLNVAISSMVRLAIIVITVLVVFHCVRREVAVSLVSVGSLSALLLSAVFLAGPLSEDHYLLLLLPGTIIMASGNSRTARYLLLGALAIAGYSAYYFGGVAGSANALQLRWVAVELLVFAASALVLMAIRTTAPDTAGVSRIDGASEFSAV